MSDNFWLLCLSYALSYAVLMCRLNASLFFFLLFCFLLIITTSNSPINGVVITASCNPLACCGGHRFFHSTSLCSCSISSSSFFFLLLFQSTCHQLDRYVVHYQWLLLLLRALFVPAWFAPEPEACACDGCCVWITFAPACIIDTLRATL